MKIATWSVNSVNERLGHLRHWLEKRQPDIVALQKIRVSRKSQRKFPRAISADGIVRPAAKSVPDHRL